jgi:hypothetical protein
MGNNQVIEALRVGYPTKQVPRIRRQYQNRDQIASKLQSASQEFVAGFLQGPGLALTVTFTNSALALPRAEVPFSCEKTIKFLIRRINKRVFRHGYDRKNFCVSSVAILERGKRNGRLHSHLAIGVPKNHSTPEFIRIVKKEIRGCQDLAGQVHVEPIRDTGWAVYMTKQPGTLLPSCCAYAKS